MNKYQKLGKIPSPRRNLKGMEGNLGKQTSISKEWASQFWAKQYFKSKYLLSEKKLRKIVTTNKPADSCAPNLINILDHRLETVVYALGWAKTLKAARHTIKKGKIRIAKGEKDLFVIKNPNIRVQIGEKITVDYPTDIYIFPPKCKNSFIIGKEKTDAAKDQRWSAILIRPVETKLAGGKDASKFELYCRKFKS